MSRLLALTGARTVQQPAPHRLRRAGAIVVSVLLALLLAFAVFVAYGTTVDNRWYKIVAIEGGSMEPTFAPGDAIVVTRPPAKLKPGMIVLLEVNGRLVTHRVVAVRSDGTFTTQGDANPGPDDWTGTKVRVAGLYRGKIPQLGRLLHIGTGAWFVDQVQTPVSASSN